MDKNKTLIDCVKQGDLSTAKQLIQEGQDPFVKDKQGFSPYSRAKNLGLTELCELFNCSKDQDGTPLPERISNHSTKINKSKKKQSKDLPYFKITAVGIVILIIVLPKIVGPGSCDDAGWISMAGQTTWSDAKYQQCLYNEKNGLSTKPSATRYSSYPQTSSVHSDNSNSNAPSNFSREKRIFLELVKLQDTGYSKELSESQIMEKYGITYSELLSILTKGAQEGWLN
jgi:hypothetical protein